ncbi:MAG: hypothetical protein JW934_18050 [Anaerolineae bacterium]|nr:hypothetical protein [Anaerolineae bacterium]
MNYTQEAIELVQNLDQRMGPSPYDIAWLARLYPLGKSSANWPDLVEWLLGHQAPDGSWGGEIVYYHDRIICTLAAVIALYENRFGWKVSEPIQRAQSYLWHHLHLLPRDPFELVGFELLLPTLLQEARALGLDVPTHTCGYGEIQTAKLRLIPPEMLYSPKISTVHSLEFLGRDGDAEQLKGARASNGSLGNSPAATAYYLTRSDADDGQANAYLADVLAHEWQVIYLYPFSTFELTWVLNNLAFSGLPITAFAGEDIWRRLCAELGPTGIGLDATFGITDGDITSVTTRLLIEAGYEVDPSILARFENKETHVFQTYKFERNISVGTNLHALESLVLLPDYPACERVKKSVLVTLLENRKYNMYWIDKWHTSPYYATSHVLIGMLREGDYLIHACHNTVEWLLHNQREDGSWGFFDRGTAEETAYALTALLHYHWYDPVPKEVLRRGALYLAQEYRKNGSAYPELWIGKCLYIPYAVVRSAILAALILYESVIGQTL